MPTITSLWREDFRLVKEIGIDFLRYGPPYYRAHVGPVQYDWSFADQTFAALRSCDIQPITDLCHFGVPDWVGDFQNPDWPRLFAEYAGAFAKRFPWVRFYTPVNEIFVAARFSGQFGWWNERLKSDRASSPRSSTWPRPTCWPRRRSSRCSRMRCSSRANRPNTSTPADPPRRIAPTPSTRSGFSRSTSPTATTSRGMHVRVSDGQRHDAARNTTGSSSTATHLRPYCVMGNDYYITNEHVVLDAAGHVEPAGEIFGYYVITKQYFERYHLPVMHTETNRKDADEAPAWLWKEWANMVRLKHDGVPILGFTWYS